MQSQLETSLEAQDQQRKVLDAINRQFGDHLHALGELQNELSAVLNTWLLHKHNESQLILFIYNDV